LIIKKIDKETINLQISYASKTAIEALEKFGGKIKLTKK
jgi:ribosomal protein L15